MKLNVKILRMLRVIHTRSHWNIYINTITIIYQFGTFINKETTVVNFLRRALADLRGGGFWADALKKIEN